MNKIDMYKFEVGKTYTYVAYGLGISRYTCTKRTEKSVWFAVGNNEFRLKLRTHEDFEFVRLMPSAAYPVLSSKHHRSE